MKLSPEQFQKLCRLLPRQVGQPVNIRLSPAEVQLLKEILKQLPENAVRHLNYKEVRQRLGQVGSREIAEKLILRRLADHLVKMVASRKKVVGRSRKKMLRKDKKKPVNLKPLLRHRPTTFPADKNLSSEVERCGP